MTMKRHSILLAGAAIALAVNSIHGEESSVVTVPGTSSPYLAGLPSGTGCCQGDTAPGQSPIEVSSFSASMRRFSFTAAGSVGHHPTGVLQPPDGNTSSLSTTAAENGISGITAPITSLLGVFLGPDAPNVPPV